MILSVQRKSQKQSVVVGDNVIRRLWSSRYCLHLNHESDKTTQNFTVNVQRYQKNPSCCSFMSGREQQRTTIVSIQKQLYWRDRYLNMSLERVRYLSSSSSSSSSSSVDGDQLSNQQQTSDNSMSSLLKAKSPLLQFHSTNLGLIETFVSNPPEVFHSICQLPEVQSALVQQSNDCTSMSGTSSANVVLGLQRSAEIFESFHKGGNEHKAILALLAECYLQRNDALSCIHTVQQLQEYCRQDSSSDSNSTNTTPTNQQQQRIVALAQAKVYWLAGNFQSTLDVCDHMLSTSTSSLSSTSFSLTSTITIDDSISSICARSCNGLARLLLASKVDDVFTIRDPFRMTIKSLERLNKQQSASASSSSSSSILLALAAAHMNMGIAEVVYAEIIAKERSLQLHHDVPLDNAMKQWKQGLTILKRIRPSSGSVTRNPNSSSSSSMMMTTMMTTMKNDRQLKIAQMLEAKMNTNMAWGLLQMLKGKDTFGFGTSGGNESIIKEASDYARKALAIYDNTVSTIEDEDTRDTSTTIGTNIASNENNSNNNNNNINKKDGLSRTLTVIAECYVKSGSAVTAEGLYQSAISNDNHHYSIETGGSISGTTTNNSTNTSRSTMDPCHIVELCNTYRSYSILYTQWEKREKEAIRLIEKANTIEEMILPKSWHNKSSIHSSLWFWTPSLLLF